MREINRSMKILIIQPWISYRGAETVSLIEAYSLQKAGHEAVICCLFVDWDRIDPKYHALSFILPSVVLRRLFMSSKKIAILFSLPVLCFLILKRGKHFDIFNPHNFPAPWACAVIKVFIHKKIVWTVHGIPKKTDAQGSFFEKCIWFFGASIIDRVFAKHIDKIIAVSEKVGDDIKKRYRRDAEIVYPCIDTNIFSSRNGKNLRKQYNIKENSFVLAHVSYLHPNKRPDLSIQIFSLIHSHIPNSYLLLVGKGPFNQKLTHLVKQIQLTDRIIFCGFQNGKSLADHYAAADVLLAPFGGTEGLPLVILEALAAGTPVIAAEGCGAEQFLEEKKFGMVVQPVIENFVQAVMKFRKEHQYWKKRAVFARIYVREHMSGEEYAKEIAAQLE